MPRSPPWAKLNHVAAEEIRVMSYNVRSLRDDQAALARVVKSCEPDILCVQEAPRFFGWRRAARKLASRAGMRVVCGGADASGNLILRSDRTEIEACEVLYLKNRPGLHLRGMALAVAKIGETRLTVGSTHLSLDPQQRLEQAFEVLGHLQRIASEHQTSSKALCGDFNAHPGSPEWHILADGMDDAWETSPRGEEFSSTAEKPYQRIDAVFVSRDLQVVGAGVPTHLAMQADMAVATDHRPVLAVLRAQTTAPLSGSS
jgi:endonuclease/exonuclease/phosphatase family metal-dependent hydrolase